MTEFLRHQLEVYFIENRLEADKIAEQVLALSGNLSNFAGGLIILVFKPFKVGDYIENAWKHLPQAPHTFYRCNAGWIRQTDGSAKQ